MKYSFLLLTLLVITLITSCSDQGMMSTPLIDTISSKEILENSSNRTNKQKIKEEIEEDRVFISVIYTGNLDNILFDESSTLYKAITKYQLNLQNPFQIDEEMKGIILTSYIEMEDPINIAKQISSGESILMVEVKNFSNQAI